MFRRVARVLRMGLCVLAVLLGAGVYISFSFGLHAYVPTSSGGVGFVIEDGYTALWYPTPGVLERQVWVARRDPSRFWEAEDAILPNWGNANGVVWFRIPLWLLAFICLAWPVTSFIVARRRRKGRGFEVEAKPGAAVSPAGG